MKKTDLVAALVAHGGEVKQYITDNILWADRPDEYQCEDLEYGLKTLAVEGHALFGALYCILSVASNSNHFKQDVSCEIFVASEEVRAQYKELADEFFSDCDKDYYEYVKFAMFFCCFEELKSAD